MIITLTTDFGDTTPYVAEMKGVLLQMVRNVTIVDVCHKVRPQDIVQASRFVERTVPLFPETSVHVAVVDPGVGTHRPIVAAELDGRFLVAPDNGLLTGLWHRSSRRTCVRLDQPQFWRPAVSHTFHGRDIMAPVAAHLARGVPLQQLGSAHHRPLLLDLPRPVISSRRIEGQVVEVDGFGNLITNIGRADLGSWDPESMEVFCDQHGPIGWVATYGQAAVGTPVALIGSSDWLEIAICQGNASQQLDVDVGGNVVVRRG